MKKYTKFLFLLIVLTFIIGCNSTQGSKQSIKSDDYYKNIFFTKWKGYAGYKFADSGTIQIPFLDFNKDYNLFSGQIKRVELLSNDKIYEVENFNIVNGSEDKNYIIRTLNVRFKTIKKGLSDINKIKLSMHDGNIITWDIGSLRIEVQDFENTQTLELGEREFVSSDFSSYSFVLNNLSNKSIVIKGLVYSNLNNIEFQTLETANLYSKESKKIVFKVKNYDKIDKYIFYYFKPFLKYMYNGKEFLFVLDFCVYSGNFTDDLVKYIKDNGKYVSINKNK